jgi:hypothetical protein
MHWHLVAAIDSGIGLRSAHRLGQMSVSDTLSSLGPPQQKRARPGPGAGKGVRLREGSLSMNGEKTRTIRTHICLSVWKYWCKPCKNVVPSYDGMRAILTCYLSAPWRSCYYMRISSSRPMVGMNIWLRRWRASASVLKTSTARGIQCRVRLLPAKHQHCERTTTTCQFVGT